jgi:hypothetical protein
MKHTLSIIFAILICWTFCNAQTDEKSKLNAISFELGKTGLIYNLNFDHKFANNSFGVRFAIGSNFGKYLNALSMGGGGYYLAGKRKHFLELGADFQYLIVDEVSDDQKGFSFVYPNYSIKTLYPSINLGYRRYNKSNVFRIGFSPAVIKSKLITGGYMAYGFTF